MEAAYVCCAGFKFYSNFDSANFARVEHVSQPGTPLDNGGSTSKIDVASSTFEFNVWTKPDCAGTEFENGNRTWFYFGIKATVPSIFVRLNIIDINKQAKMYSQGMAPVFKVVPGKPIWERIRDKLNYSTSSENIFSLSFKYRTPDNPDAIVYFAFTYPYSYTDLQHSLRLIDDKYLHAPTLSTDDIYYVRECVCKSVEGRRIDLLTISSHHNITREREDRLQSLFSDRNVPRPFKFVNKKVIFVSARVHPGETPSTFVLNGLLNLLLCRDDTVALVLRRHYVFKLMPFLNPDGVARGHYRTDTRGTNLNRVYLQPNIQRHPSVYAARALLRYHHHAGRELLDRQLQLQQINPELQPIIAATAPTSMTTSSLLRADASNAEIIVERDVSTLIESTIVTNDRRLSNISLTEEEEEEQVGNGDDAAAAANVATSAMLPLTAATVAATTISTCSSREQQLTFCKRDEYRGVALEENVSGGCMDDLAALQRLVSGGEGDADDDDAVADSGLFLYMDMHGHASKKGIFMYGNHFDNMVDSVECMLLPKIMSLNNHNFHFTACNFTERNMYLKDRRDGMSREGSGRVAISKLTGLVRSYTLECNYNTGRLTNTLPPTVRNTCTDSVTTSSSTTSDTYSSPVPPKYNPHVFEEVGRALGASILDLTGQNPVTRLPNSEFHSLNGLRQWLMTNCAPHATSITAPLINIHHYQANNQTQAPPYLVDNDNAVAAPTTTTAPMCATNRKSSQGIWRSSVSQALSSGGCSRAASTLMRCHHHHNRRRHHYYGGGYMRHTAPHTTAVTRTTRSTVGGGAATTAAATSGVRAVVANSAATPSFTAGKRRLNMKSGSSMMQAAAAASLARQQHIAAAKQQMSPSSTSSSTIPKRQSGATSASNNNSRRLKLREICWIKGGADTGQGKALIAKYTTSAASVVATAAAATATSVGGVATAAHNVEEENLIVSWDVNNANPQVFAQRISMNSVVNVHHVAASCSTGSNNQCGNRTKRCTAATSTAAAAAVGGVGGSSNKRPTFRVHNFRRRHYGVNHHPIITSTAAEASPVSGGGGSSSSSRRQQQRQQQQQQISSSRPVKLLGNNTTKKQTTAIRQHGGKLMSHTSEGVTAPLPSSSTSGATIEPSQQQQTTTNRSTGLYFRDCNNAHDANGNATSLDWS